MTFGNVARAVAVVGIIVTLGACGDDAQKGATADRTDALPSTYEGEFLQVLEGEPGAGGRVVVGTELTSDNNTEAVLEITFEDQPGKEGGSVECGGRTFDAVATLDQSEEAEGTVQISRHGTVELDIERNVGVVMDEDAPPVCDEWEGTWTGTGELEGRSGTFLLVGFHDDNTETYTESLTLTEN